MARDRWSVPTVKVVIALCLVLGSSLVPVLELSAQTPQATLTGTVLDASAAALPGVTVTLAPQPFGTPRSSVTDAEGRYRFEALPGGDYRLQAALSGFGTREALVTLAAGETRTLDITLDITTFTETVTVTVTRTEQEQARVPNAVSVIEGDAIQAFTRRASPAETFAGVPGFYVENRRNFSLSGGVRFAIRAPLPRFGMRGVQILQDGVPMTMADGTTEPTNIDLGSLGRVEVLRGPSSVLYGNSAGGVITLQSEFPASRFIIQPDVQWGSYGYEQQQLKAAGTTPKVSYLVNANRMEIDGFRLHSHAEVRRANVVVRAAPTNTTEIRGVFNVYDLPFGESASTVTLADARDNPTSVRPQAFTQGWGESTTQNQTGLTLQHQITNGHVIRATGWGVWRDVWNPIPAAVITVDRQAAGIRSEYAGSAAPRGIPMTWTTGFDVSLQHDERAEYGNNGVPPGGGLTQEGALRLAQLEEVRSISPFVHVTAQLGDRWNVSGGARYDRYHFRATDRFLSNGDQSGERTLDAVSPMVGVTFAPSSWLNLYSNVATAYQTPTTVELSNRPTDDEGGFNQDLGPEDLRSFEVGARGAITAWRARFEVASYFSTIDNAIVRFQRADEQAYFRNAGEVTRNGLEVLFEWSPTPRVIGRFAYTFQDFQYGNFVAPEGDFSDNTEPGAPPHQVVIGGSYHAPFGLFSSAQFRFVDAYPVNSANTIDNWAYQVVDLRFGFDRRWNGLRFRPFFSIDNIFDERYNSSAIVNSIGDRFFEPSPGREYAVGLTVGFGPF